VVGVGGGEGGGGKRNREKGVVRYESLWGGGDRLERGKKLVDKTSRGV